MLDKFIKFFLVVLIVYLLYTMKITSKVLDKIRNFEHFDNFDKDIDPQIDENNDPFLYPLRSDYCRNNGLQNAVMPKLCCLPGQKCDVYANCRCIDPATNECAECWRDIDVSFHNYVLKKRIKAKEETKGK